MNKKPRIAIPLGDPAGVGPEIVVKSIASQEVFDAAECVVIGDKKIIDKGKVMLSLAIIPGNFFVIFSISIAY